MKKETLYIETPMKAALRKARDNAAPSTLRKVVSRAVSSGRAVRRMPAWRVTRKRRGSVRKNRV